MRASPTARATSQRWLLAIGLVLTASPLMATGQEMSRTLVGTRHHPDGLRSSRAVIDAMHRQETLRLTAVVTDPLVAGHVHRRFAQFHHGVRVVGGDVTTQTTPQGVTTVLGHVYDDLRVDTRPTLTPAEARDAAARVGATATTAAPSLVIAPDAGGTHRLVYRMTAAEPHGPMLYDVDAHTGAIRSAAPRIETQRAILPCAGCAVGEGRGVKGDRKKLSVSVVDDVFGAEDQLRLSRISTYDMRGDWVRTLDVLNERSALSEADLAMDSDNDWRDGASVDAHTGTGWTLDYLFHRFGREGLDGERGPVVVLVHPIDRAEFLTAPEDVALLFHLNAFFCQSCGSRGMLVFGEGLPPGLSLGQTGQTVDFFAAGVDIVAHEIGHAVTGFTSQLVYRGESGALSEAFSDLLAVGLEFFIAESQRHPSEQPDYLIGEDVLKPGGIRSLANPASLGDPDHYTRRFIGSADRGGVHTNSTIVTHAFYLTVEGGTNRTSGLPVTGLGPENRALVEQIFYRAFVFLLPASATFSMARTATLESARDLSSDAMVEQIIAQAWTAVGVD